jgi:hypothetical protein
VARPNGAAHSLAISPIPKINLPIKVPSWVSVNADGVSVLS